MDCKVCYRPLRQPGERQTPGTLLHGGRGLCSTHYKNLAASGELDNYPVLATGPESWSVTDCAGKCGKRVRQTNLRLADHPGTVADCGGKRCSKCRGEWLHGTQRDQDRKVEANRASLDAWHRRKEALAYGATTRKLTRGIGVRI